MRLDKFIATNSRWSRSDVKKLVKQRRILLNDLVVEDSASKINPLSDRVNIGAESIMQPAEQYYMLHKPAGLVCANIDSEHPTVLDLIQSLPAVLKQKLQIVGRLDLDTTGLVLLTDNGRWNHRITSPVNDCKKKYLVELADDFNESTRVQFSEGMMLQGESKITRPAEVEVVSSRILRLSLSEGRYHQVKRMIKHTGNELVRLHRESVGGIVLDPSLAPGQYRPLNHMEIHSV